MTDIQETEDWVEGIYQLEKTDPLLGGPPDLAAGEGFDNVQAQQLASRTSHLRARVVGLEALTFDIETDDFNDALEPGNYVGLASATGAPPVGDDSIGVFVETRKDVTRSEDDNKLYLFQTARTIERGERPSKVFVRSMNQANPATPAWSEWTQVWTGADASLNLSVNGYQKLPSGLIFQWGYVVGSNNSTHTFRTAFPTRALVITLTDFAASDVDSNVHILSCHQLSATGFTMLVYEHYGAPEDVSSAAYYFAVGY